MSTKKIKQFINSDEPMGSIEINGEKYDVYSPENLKEKYYILYFEGRAKSMDIVSKYMVEVEDENGNKVSVPSDKFSDTIRLELEMIEPVKEVISALLQVDYDTLDIKPKLAVEIYRELETMLVGDDKPLEDEGIPEKKEVKKGKGTPAKSAE